MQAVFKQDNVGPFYIINYLGNNKCCLADLTGRPLMGLKSGFVRTETGCASKIEDVKSEYRNKMEESITNPTIIDQTRAKTINSMINDIIVYPK
jgi:hypothetical protein